MFKPFTLFAVPQNTNATVIPDDRLCYSCREAEAVCGLLCPDCVSDIAERQARSLMAPNARALPPEMVCTSCNVARPVRDGLCRDCLVDVSGVFEAPQPHHEHPHE